MIATPIPHKNSHNTVKLKTLLSTILIGVTVSTRVVHGSGGSGFCPTCNQPVQDWVGYFSARNRSVTVTDSSVQIAGKRLVLGEPDIH